jgi:Na+-translocating ferredoxin:NAD+ oxidoreductase RNF subunit RnfB
MEILLPILAIGGMGLVFGAILAVASKIFAVEKDERIPLVAECLPGANCGGCGFAGCQAAAEAIVNGKASVNCCPVGGNASAEKIAAIMGVASERTERMTAFVMCSGAGEVAKTKYDSNEHIDCHIANRLSGGMKECPYGCLGFGSCVNKCMFGALAIKNGVAVVDREKCTNCGACMAECPRHLIKSIPYSAKAAVACTSNDKGKDTRNACGVGCIGCGLCARNCEAQAITIIDNCAVIDYKKCVGCGICQDKCPREIIKMFNNTPELCVE